VNRRRVAIVQRALRRYQAGFYDLLREELAETEIELLVFHSTLPPGRDARDDGIDLPWSVCLERHTTTIAGRPVVWQPLVAELRTADLVIVEQASQLLLNYRLLLRQARGGPKVAFWGHGRSFADEPSATGERLKAWTSRRPHWWFAHTSLSADIVTSLGFDAGRITVVDNAIDTSALRRDLAGLHADDLQAVREEFGLGPGPVGLFLGNLREDKRLDVLVAAASLVRSTIPEFQLLVVGYGSLAGELREAAERRPWLHVVGPRYGADRAAFLALADVLLIPGAVGLVVLDSFVARTPLITSREGAHGPEIAYVRDGENGLLVSDGTDPKTYASAVVGVLEDPGRLDRLRAGCAADAGRYSVETMATRFAEGIRRALEAPRKR
jgi:glycosyltransferase involved in cell wall biosynthesis